MPKSIFIEEIPDDLRQSFVSLDDASPVAEESPRQKNLKFGEQKDIVSSPKQIKRNKYFTTGVKNPYIT